MRLAAALLLIAACTASSDPVDPANPGDGGSGDDGPADGPGSGHPDAPPAGDVTVVLDEPAGAVVGVATRDGDGAWRPMPAPANGEIQLHVTSGRWMVAWACQASRYGVGEYTVSFGAFTTAERTSWHPAQACFDRPSARISGHVTHGGSGSTYLAFGPRATIVYPFTDGYYSADVVPGTHDAFLFEETSASAGEIVTTNVAIRRGVTAVFEGADAVADFDFAAGYAPTAPLPVTFANHGDGSVYVTTSLYSADGSSVPLDTTTDDAPHMTRGLPAAALAAGDVYLQQASRECLAITCPAVAVEHWTRTVGALDVAFPDLPGAVTASVNATYDTHVAWHAAPGATAYQLEAGEFAAYPVEWHGVIGPAYAGASPALDIPDVGTFWPSYAYQPSANFTVRISALRTSGGLDDAPFRYPAPAGTDRTSATDLAVVPASM